MGSQYDALLDLYEPGMRSAEGGAMCFERLRRWLPGLIRDVVARQANETLCAAGRPFAVDAQKALGGDVMALLGFNFDAGRFDVSTHPSGGGVPRTRMTTRFTARVTCCRL